MYFCLTILFGFIGGYLRRVWGGGLNIPRMLKILLMIILSYAIVYVKKAFFNSQINEIHFYLSCFSLVIIQAPHGGFFTIMSETVRDRKQPYKSIVHWLCGDKEYKIIGNYIGLNLCYLVRASIVSYFILNVGYLIIAPIIATIYLLWGLVWKRYFEGKSQEFIYNNWWDYSKFSEVYSGFFQASLLFLLV